MRVVCGPLHFGILWGILLGFEIQADRHTDKKANPIRIPFLDPEG